MSTPEPEFDPLDAVGTRLQAVGYDNLNDFEKKSYYAVYWFSTETENGGLHQFFFNSTGGYVLEVRMGLRMMGATEILKILDHALAIIGRTELPRGDNERREIILKLSEDAQDELDALTDEFYDCPESLFKIEAEFVQKNRNHFGGET